MGQNILMVNPNKTDQCLFWTGQHYLLSSWGICCSLAENLRAREKREETVEQSVWRVKLHECVEQVIRLQLERERRKVHWGGMCPGQREVPERQHLHARPKTGKGDMTAFGKTLASRE